MNNLIKFVIFGLTVLTAHGFPSQPKRQAFNPNLLMDRYMNVRTDQGTFGSYHPNDIKQDVDRFFQNGGGQVHTENQWGLMVYNPNAAMPQYMGQQQEPGNLAPGFQGGETAVDHSNQDDGEAIHGGFNPTELNRQLMHAVQTPKYSSLGSGSGAFGFNPDAVNRQLMMSVQSHAGQSQPSPSSSQTSPADQSSNSTRGGGHQSAVQQAGFNADKVNAGLYGSIGYNPNAVNSATFNMPSFGSSGHHASGGNPGNTATQSGASGHNIPTANGASAAAVGSQNGQPGTGNGAAAANGQLAQTNAANVQQTGAQMAGTAHASGIGQMGGFNPFSANKQTGGNVVPSTRVSQNGVPPGILPGMKLSQTETEDPVASGIGGLGV